MKLRFLIGLTAAVLLLVAPPAQAQSETKVDGTADYRNPPLLRPGSYRDTIVTGETVWYGVVYTNNLPYRFEVAVQGSGIDNIEPVLDVAFVGPTLAAVDAGSTLLEGSASYDGGRTNVWYLEVSLESEGRLGVEYELQIDIAGVEDAGLVTCDELPDCTLDDQLAAVEDEIAVLDADLAELPEEATAEAIQADIDRLETNLNDTNNRVDKTNDAIASICHPDDDCVTAPPPRPKPSTGGLIAGVLILLAGLVLLGRQVMLR